MALFAAFGCASASPEPSTGVEPERPPTTVVREAARPVTTLVRASFQYAPGTASYVVTSEATIAELDSTASAARTFREVARVELTITAADGQTVVITRGSVETSTAASLFPLYADTLRAERMDIVAEPRIPICGRDTVPPVHLGTLLPPVPRELREGLRWQRRQIYASCQGTIPIRVERIDSYMVTGRAPQIAGSGVTLSRSSSLAYNGSGVEGQHNVRISGSGSAEATLNLDASSGRLLNAVEEIQSEIHITASGRTRRFTQRVARSVNRP